MFRLKWLPQPGNEEATPPARTALQQVCLFSVAVAFVLGVSVGVFVPVVPGTVPLTLDDDAEFAQVRFVATAVRDGVIADGIYWDGEVEAALPSGFNGSAARRWRDYVVGARAVRLEPGCGRMQNRRVVLADGRVACARYRQNTDQLQGEIFSALLAQLLRLPNLAPAAVSVVDPEAALWWSARGDLATAQWAAGHPVVLTQHVPRLRPARIPPLFRPADRPFCHHDVANLSRADLLEAAQWSDLVLFDYLTANLDRVVNNLYNRQWNSQIMEAPAHNLAVSDGGLLVFLDNESGLLHGYRLLRKYEVYHAALLERLCIFRRRTAAALVRLWRAGDVGERLHALWTAALPPRARDALPTLPDASVRVLQQRLERVVVQLSRCAALYAPPSAAPP